MLNCYKTIENTVQIELIEKKSKFIAQAYPISIEEEAKKWIEKTKKQYWDASHHVYAYCLGEQNELQRASDDGEPQGTAGKPVLEVLLTEQIKNTLLIVTRYFGGTLLGTGGLVRAYGKSAKEAILAAGIVEKRLCYQTELCCEYPLLGKMQNELSQHNFLVQETIYTDKVTFHLHIEIEKKEEIIRLVTDISNGQAIIIFGEKRYIT